MVLSGQGGERRHQGEIFDPLLAGDVVEESTARQVPTSSALAQVLGEDRGFPNQNEFPGRGLKTGSFGLNNPTAAAGDRKQLCQTESAGTCPSPLKNPSPRCEGLTNHSGAHAPRSGF